MIDLSPARQDLRFWRGDGIRFSVTVTNAQTGAAVNLSTCAIYCTAKRLLTDTDLQAVFQVTKALGAIVVTGASNNVAQILIPAALTAVLTTNETLFYDVQIDGPAVQDEPQTVVWGTLTMTLDVTRAIT